MCSCKRKAIERRCSWSRGDVVLPSGARMRVQRHDIGNWLALSITLIHQWHGVGGKGLSITMCHCCVTHCCVTNLFLFASCVNFYEAHGLATNAHLKQLVPNYTYAEIAP